MVGEAFLNIISGIYIISSLIVFIVCMPQAVNTSDSRHDVWLDDAIGVGVATFIIDTIVAIVIAFLMWACGYKFADSSEVMIYLRSDIFHLMLTIACFILFVYGIILELSYHPIQKFLHFCILQKYRHVEKAVEMLEDYAMSLEKDLEKTDDDIMASCIKNELHEVKRRLYKARSRKLKSDIAVMKFERD